MKKIMQFRYEGFGNSNNYPSFSDYNTALVNGNIFEDYRLISKLGIQAPIGMRFYLNNGQYPITIGKTGIYELDLEAIGRIHSIRFVEEDLEEYFADEELHNRLLIDIVYDGGTSV